MREQPIIDGSRHALERVQDGGQADVADAVVVDAATVRRKIDLVRVMAGVKRARDLAAGGHKKLLLNLAEISYIDSSGIGELVSGFTTVANQGGTVKLLNLTKRVQDLLQITKLYTVFEVHDDEAKAVQSFK